jgi:hypothetical protein
MIRKFIALFRRKVVPDYVPEMADVIIATRALRLYNRNREGAAKYQRVHEILKARK